MLCISEFFPRIFSVTLKRAEFFPPKDLVFLRNLFSPKILSMLLFKIATSNVFLHTKKPEDIKDMYA